MTTRTRKKPAPPVIDVTPNPVSPITEEINRRVAAGEEMRDVLNDISAREAPPAPSPSLMVTFHYTRRDGSQGFANNFISDMTEIRTQMDVARIKAGLMEAYPEIVAITLFSGSTSLEG